MAGIDGGFPKRDVRDRLRDWCLDNADGGEFRLRWHEAVGRLTVSFQRSNAAFAFKLRHQEDVIFESGPEQIEEA